MIQAAVGISTTGDARRAALEAGKQICGGLGDRRPDWCVAFVTAEHESRLGDLLETLAGAVGTPYVSGCSAAGVLTSGHEIETGPALTVMAVASDRIRATPFLFHDEGDHGISAGVRLGQRMQQSRGRDDLLLVWPDPFRVRPDRLIHGLDAVLAGVPVVGGAASARGDGQATFQFCGEETGVASVSGVRLGGEFRHTVGVTQGCRPLGEPLRVTRAHENLMLELDGRPALEVLRERAPAGLTDDLQRAMHVLSVGLVPPEGERDAAGGAYLVRNIIDADPDTGVLAVADRLEEGQLVVLAQRDAPSAEADVRRMLDRVSPAQTGLDYRFGFYFNCLARGSSLYDAPGTDAKLLAEALPGLPLIGFFCNAEIAPLRGVNQLFTYTGVLLLVAE